MVIEDFKRISFKEVIEILDPELTCDFKQSSYYHNEFKSKLAKRKQTQTLQLNGLTDKEISSDKSKDIQRTMTADTFCEYDNYM